MSGQKTTGKTTTENANMKDRVKTAIGKDSQKINIMILASSLLVSVLPAFQIQIGEYYPQIVAGVVGVKMFLQENQNNILALRK